MTLPPIKIGDHPCSPTMIWSDLEIAWITEYAQAAVLAERAACAALCDTRSADHWHDYKDGPLGVRGMPRSEHASDEAEGCAAAIRARGE